IGEGIAGIRDLASDADHRPRGSRTLQIDDAAAILVDLVVIADNPDLEIAAHRLDQQLAASKPAIPLVRVFARAEVFEEAVALVEPGSEAGRHAFTQGSRDVALGDNLVVVAVSPFD